MDGGFALLQHNMYIMRGRTLTDEPVRDILRSGNYFLYTQRTRLIPGFVPTSGLVFDRRVLEKVLPIPAGFRICADGYLTRTAFCFGGVATINRCLGAYRVHGGNNTYENPNFASKDYIDNLLIPEINKFYRINGIELEFYERKSQIRKSLEGLRLRKFARVLVPRSASIDITNDVLNTLFDVYPSVSVDLLVQRSVASEYTDRRINKVVVSDGMFEGRSLRASDAQRLQATEYDVGIVPYSGNKANEYDSVHDIIADINGCRVVGIKLDGDIVDVDVKTRKRSLSKRNLQFNMQINRLYRWCDKYKREHKKIAIYGGGYAGKLMASYLGGNVVVVADKSPELVVDINCPVCKADEVSNYDFDVIIISVLGRENIIFDYLVKDVGVEAKKIQSIDLAKDPEIASHVSEDYKSLVARIAENRPIIGSHPLSVQIQTVSACNAKCYFCPYVGSWHEKNPGRMSDDLYAKILNDLSKYRISRFSPYLENEPFLDKKLFERVRMAIDVLSPEIVEISTNLSILTDRHVDGIINVLSKVENELRISFHGVNRETYENVMELDYNVTLDNVKRVVSLMQEYPLKVVIRGAGMPRIANENASAFFDNNDYMEFWRRELMGFRVQPKIEYFSYHDRSGQSQMRQKGIVFNAGRKTLDGFYCIRFDRWVHFLYTGEPILCCMDYNRETVLPMSAQTTSVDGIYNSGEFIETIKRCTGMVDSDKNHICKRCISPGG
jgi:hypothetical protein